MFVVIHGISLKCCESFSNVDSTEFHKKEDTQAPLMLTFQI